MLVALPNAYGDAATNMAIDSALLETIPEGFALFRHYGWLEPATTFGYAQFHSQVESGLTTEHSQPSIIRRPTGGGIVDHRNDWTYALILCRALACTNAPPTQLYQQIHQAISQALESLGIQTRLAPCPRVCQSKSPGFDRRTPPAAAHCFVQPAADDVLRQNDNRKIAGAAMKRTARGLLIQGSIDRAALPGDFDYQKFQEALIQKVTNTLSIPQHTLEDIRPLFDSQRIEILKKKFASNEWNHRR